jgi:alpha-L-fucosidase
MKFRAIVALAAAIVGAAFFTPAAQAAPSPGYPPHGCPGQLSVSTTHPLPGETITVTGTNFTPGARVHLVMHSKVYDLGTFTANAQGQFSAQVTLPHGVFGRHFIIATSGAPHIKQCEGDPIQIQAPPPPTPPGHHGTSFTGTDILVILLVAAGLLGAGVALTRGGKRRRGADAA